MGGISGVSGLGAMSALGTTGGLNGPLGDVNVAAMSAMPGTRMGELLQLLDGFSSAEILMALMLANHSGHHRRYVSGNDSGLIMLLGRSLATQVGQNIWHTTHPGRVPAPQAPTGQFLNLTA